MGRRGVRRVKKEGVRVGRGVIQYNFIVSV